MKKPIVIHTYRFRSSSGSGTYETLLYSDGSTSCDCPGWTKRCVNGFRNCKHTRAVQSGMSAVQCLDLIAHSDVSVSVELPETKTQDIEPSKPGFRKFV